MLPQIRQIQRLVVDSQEEHADKVGADGFANGMEGAEEETLGCDDMSVCEYRHTGHLDKKEIRSASRCISMTTYRLSPHLLKHMQWNVWEHGTVINPVTAESMRSRQTGQVGSSYRAWVDARRDNAGSSASMVTDRTRTTWHISGYSTVKIMKRAVAKQTDLHGIERFSIVCFCKF
jgi:hypothetical protein